jgi:hypothetical protein
VARILAVFPGGKAMTRLSSKYAFSREAAYELRQLETTFRYLRLGWLVPLAITLTNVVATVLSLQNV